MVKRHLKRISAPKTWPLKRKKEVFVKRPFPTGNTIENSLPLVVIFRDLLKKVKTGRELNYVIINKGIYINGKKARSTKDSAGLMDVISIPETNEHFRVLINGAGLLTVLKIDEKEANVIPLMVRDKSKLKQGKTQLNFANGHNFIVDKDEYKSGEVLLYDYNNKKTTQHLKLEKGSMVYFTRGRYIGKTARVEEIKKDSIVYKRDGETFEVPKDSSKEYSFLIGTKEPLIKLAD
ncbi:MAG: hypothetical protein ACOCZQ_02705 [Nanoarchaeota archaeon]